MSWRGGAGPPINDFSDNLVLADLEGLRNPQRAPMPAPATLRPEHWQIS
ncbi:hypothetical protein [Streptomyces cyslabdanicus]